MLSVRWSTCTPPGIPVGSYVNVDIIVIDDTVILIVFNIDEQFLLCDRERHCLCEVVHICLPVRLTSYFLTGHLLLASVSRTNKLNLLGKNLA